MIYINIVYLFIYVLITQNSISKSNLYNMYYSYEISNDEFVFLKNKLNEIRYFREFYCSINRLILILYIFAINKLKLINMVSIIFIIKFIYDSIKYCFNKKTNFFKDLKNFISFNNYFYSDILITKLSVNRSQLICTLHIVALFIYIAIIV